MAMKIEDLLFPTAAGLGALLIAPVVLPIVGRVVRPLLVGAIRTGMTVYAAGRL